MALDAGARLGVIAGDFSALSGVALAKTDGADPFSNSASSQGGHSAGAVRFVQVYAPRFVREGGIRT
jgi:hypothetical protein